MNRSHCPIIRLWYCQSILLRYILALQIFVKIRTHIDELSIDRQPSDDHPGLPCPRQIIFIEPGENIRLFLNFTTVTYEMAQEDETEELPTAYGVMIAVITGLLGYVLWDFYGEFGFQGRDDFELVNSVLYVIELYSNFICVPITIIQ
ncbi:Protein of unknown function [Cotesia congregata]|uniref:Uncharacterized protein n=1 Tax=Cotesia congregata TaxID=51543 RepID=A0A8J2HQ32_COTCN|nr:Protein of unknown function [Cotesia congregata]